MPLFANPVREGFFESEGRRFFYRQEGQGPDVVLLHGYTSNHAMWSFQRAALGAHHRLLTLDLPGHGQSDELPHPHGPEVFASLTRRLMDHLGVRKAHIGGLSMGGFVAQAFAQQYPSRTRSLMLCDTSGRRMHPFLRGLFHLMHLAGRHLQHAQIEGFIDLYHQRRSNRYRGAAGISPAQAEEVMRTLLTHRDPLAMAREAMVLVQKPDQLDVVRQLAVPLLIVCGTADIVFSESLHMLDERPYCRFVALEKIPHGTAVGHPLAFNHAMLSFLTDVEKGGHPLGLWFYPAAKPDAPPRHTTREELETFRQKSVPLWPLWKAWWDLDEGLEKIFRSPEGLGVLG